MTDIVERLRKPIVRGFTHPTDDLHREAADEVERMRAALQWLMKQPWKSVDKDNMEFQVTVTCYVRDALLAALEPKR